MKIKGTIAVEFTAPDDADAWNLVRIVSTNCVMALGRHGCSDIKPDIVSVTADGRRVSWKPKKP